MNEGTLAGTLVGTLAASGAGTRQNSKHTRIYKFQETCSTIENKTNDHIEVQTCSNSTNISITHIKRGRMDSSQLDVDCDNVQFSAKKKSNKLADN